MQMSNNIKMRNQNINEVLLSRKETSQLLKISLPTLFRWTKEGKIISYKMGGRVYYKYSEIMEPFNIKNEMDDYKKEIQKMDDFEKEIEKMYQETELKNQKIQLFTDLKINMIELIGSAMKKELGDSITPYFTELDKYFEKAKSLRK